MNLCAVYTGALKCLYYDMRSFNLCSWIIELAYLAETSIIYKFKNPNIMCHMIVHCDGDLGMGSNVNFTK